MWGVGKDLTIDELASRISKLVDFEGKINWDESKASRTSRKLLDSSKVFELGWKPKTAFEEGLKQTIECYIGSKRAQKD